MKTDKDFVRIKKLTLKIGKREITLTPDEARKLHQALDSLFEKEVKVVEKIVWKEYPIYIERVEKPWQPYPWITWCGTTLESNSIDCEIK